MNIIFNAALYLQKRRRRKKLWLTTVDKILEKKDTHEHTHAHTHTSREKERERWV